MSRDQQTQSLEQERGEGDTDEQLPLQLQAQFMDPAEVVHCQCLYCGHIKWDEGGGRERVARADLAATYCILMGISFSLSTLFEL